jgi:hypothetical protein
VSYYSFIVNVVGTANTVNAGIDRTICAGGSVGLNATSSGATSYTWSPGTGLSCTNCQNPTASPTVTTVYTVSATFPDGCTLTDNLQVTVTPLPVVTITPGVVYACPGAAVTLTGSSTPAAASHLWSTGALRHRSRFASIDHNVLVPSDFGGRMRKPRQCDGQYQCAKLARPATSSMLRLLELVQERRQALPT